jgi:uncharacterized protein
MSTIGDTGRARVQTFTGRFVHPFDLQTDEVDIIDIAHALSNVCRFQGHTSDFYSVAQHSLICSHLVPDGLELPALLHDATEAYICDLAGPLKRDTEVGLMYKEIENRVAATIEEAFGLEVGAFDDPHVKLADWEVLQVEGRDLMPPNDWARSDILPDMKIKPSSPADARDRFLERYQELT